MFSVVVFCAEFPQSLIPVVLTLDILDPQPGFLFSLVHLPYSLEDFLKFVFQSSCLIVKYVFPQICLEHS